MFAGSINAFTGFFFSDSNYGGMVNEKKFKKLCFLLQVRKLQGRMVFLLISSRMLRLL